MKKKIFKKILCFDIDGVICKTKSNQYQNSIPIKKTIKLINYLYDENYYIKLFTASYMGRNNENKLLAKKNGLALTKNQLNRWGLKIS